MEQAPMEAAAAMEVEVMEVEARVGMAAGRRLVIETVTAMA